MDPLQAQIQNQLLVQALQGPKPATQAMPPAVNQMGSPPPNYMNQIGQPPGMLGAQPPSLTPQQLQQLNAPPVPPLTPQNARQLNGAGLGPVSAGSFPAQNNMQGMGQQPQMTPALQKLLAGTL